MAEGSSNMVTNRVPALVSVCQRVLAANIDAVCSFGEDMPHRLVKPILQGCPADTLLRLENESPHLINDNEELWKDQCFRNYPVLAEGYLDSDCVDSVSWRAEFLHLREEEDRRLEEASSRIRNQRLEAEELKRKRQVKYSDRLPPPKRPRQGWSSGPAPPKSLFQKTRAEASKLQKNVFGMRAGPAQVQMSSSVVKRPKLGPPSVAYLPQAKTAPVPVTTITVRSSCAPSHSSLEPIKQREVQSSPPPHCEPRPPTRSPQETRSPPKPPGMAKKDPMAALFVPKHRAHSQLSGRVR